MLLLEGKRRVYRREELEKNQKKIEEKILLQQFSVQHVFWHASF